MKLFSLIEINDLVKGCIIGNTSISVSYPDHIQRANRPNNIATNT